MSDWSAVVCSSDLVTPSAQPEFSRLERLDTMGRMSKPARIEAEADEREGLRRRFRLEALNSLAAEYTLAKDEGKIIANGRIMADLVQACVATAARSEEHTSELQSLMRISYAVFCLKKKQHVN